MIPHLYNSLASILFSILCFIFLPSAAQTTCIKTVTDTIRYIEQTKAPNGFIKLSLSDNNNVDMNPQTDDGYTGYAQVFEVPVSSTVSLTGVCFYAYVDAETPLSAQVRLYELAADGNLNTSVLIESVEVTVPIFMSNMDIEFPLEPSLQLCANFSEVRSFTKNYVITLENFSATEMIIPVNYNNDGGGEGNLYTYYYWASDPQFDGWYHVTDFSNFDPDWDIDVRIEPIVEYFDISSTVTVASNGRDVSIINEIEGGASTEIFAHRMYNPNYLDYSTDFILPVEYDYGDGTVDAIGEHSYSGHAGYTINVEHSLWTNVSSCSFDIEPILGSQDDLFAQTINAYPNPTQGSITFDLGSEKEKVLFNIMDNSGRKVLSTEYHNTSSIKASLQNLPSGVYIAKINTGNEEAMMRIRKTN